MDCVGVPRRGVTFAGFESGVCVPPASRSLERRGLLVLVSRVPARGGWPPGPGCPGLPDAVSDQGLSDVEGSPVIPPPL